MRNSRQGLLLIIAVFVLLPEIGNAEIYSPPCHVRDPALPSKRGEADPSLPFIYLEPHEGCFDISKPLTVTIYAVNRSGTTMAVDWSAILESLTLEPVGPGKARPLSRRPNVESVDVGLTSFARLTIDLKDHFVLEGASAYRVTYARPLSDGRIHVASPVTFVVEDSAEIEAIAKEVGDAPARATVATLLKCNPLFAQGVVLKTYGHEDHLWPSLQMRRTCWQTNVGQSTARWQDGVNQLTGEGGPEGDVRALEVLIERLLHLSDNLRVPLDSYAFYLLTKSVEENFKPQHRERIYLKLAGTRDSWVVGQSIGRLVGYEIIESYQDPLTEGGPTLDILFAIADGPDRELAREAISCLSN